MTSIVRSLVSLGFLASASLSASFYQTYWIVQMDVAKYADTWVAEAVPIVSFTEASGKSPVLVLEQEDSAQRSEILPGAEVQFRPGIDGNAFKTDDLPDWNTMKFEAEPND